MAFSNLLKKITGKEKEERARHQKKSAAKEAEIGAEKVQEKEVKVLPEISSVEDEVIFHLVRSHVTEKSTMLNSQNKYTFWVKNIANKGEVKRAVEKLYKVKVANVNIINPKPKKIRLGKFTGVRPVYKKAIVTVAEGQRIETI